MNGFRLEASEIINLLPSEIKSAHVMVKSDQLVLYKTNEVSATEVKKILDANLPPYMVPRMFFTIDRFPLNKNRKLDVSQLTLEAQAEMIQVEEVKNGESTEEENFRRTWIDGEALADGAPRAVSRHARRDLDGGPGDAQIIRAVDVSRGGEVDAVRVGRVRGETFHVDAP